MYRSELEKIRKMQYYFFTIFYTAIIIKFKLLE